MSLLLLLFYTLLWITLILIVDKFVEFMKDFIMGQKVITKIEKLRKIWLSWNVSILFLYSVENVGFIISILIYYGVLASNENNLKRAKFSIRQGLLFFEYINLWGSLNAIPLRSCGMLTSTIRFLHLNFKYISAINPCI